MISIIVPTMWKANQFFSRMLSNIDSCDSVGEIIIIDNNIKQRNDDILSLSNKIRYLPMVRNTFFNPSLNFGYMKAKFDILCFMNDDVVFDHNVFNFVNQNIKQNYGVITPNPKIFNTTTDKQLEFIPTDRTRDGFGCTMFLMKKNFKEIPNEITFHFGDEFIYMYQENQGRTNMTLQNWCIETPMRVTTKSTPEIQPVIAKDWSVATAVFAKYGLPNPIKEPE